MFYFFRIINSSGIINGISSYYFIRSVLYLLPNIFLISIPFSLVFSIFFCIGEISIRGEFIDIRVGGFSYKEITRLMFIFVIFLSIFYYILASYIEPIYSYKSREYLRMMINRITNINIKENVFNGVSSFVINPRYVNGNFMRDIVMFRDFNYEGNDNHILKIEANRGEFKFINEKGIEIFLSDGKITHIPKDNLSVVNKGRFSDYYVFIPFEFKEMTYSIPYKHMTTNELKKIFFIEKDTLKKSMIKKEIYERIAKSFSVILFFILSITLSFYYEKESRYFSFISSLGVLFLYYSLSTISDVFFRKNTSLFYIDFLPVIFMSFFSFYFYLFKLRFK